MSTVTASWPASVWRAAAGSSNTSRRLARRLRNWAVRAERFELVLTKGMHVKNVPGRKTDVNDAMWLADLLAQGLIRASFVPPMAVQALRDLTRARKQLMREKVSHVQSGSTRPCRRQTSNSAQSCRTSWARADGRSSMPWRKVRPTPPLHTRIHASRAQVVEALRGRACDHQRLPLRIHLVQADAAKRPFD
jgi:transposase